MIVRRLLAATLLVAASIGGALAQGYSPDALRQDARDGRTKLFVLYYRSGVARLGRGDPAAALAVFETASAVAPELPELQYCRAVAIVLADFSKRADALPPIRAALKATPDDPLYGVIAALADPSLSSMGDDGALYFTSAGAKIVDQATPRLAGERDAYNAKYLALLLGTRESTGKPDAPERLPRFAAMLGAGTSVTLPNVGAQVSLGRLLELDIPDSVLKKRELRFVERLISGDVADAQLVTGYINAPH